MSVVNCGVTKKTFQVIVRHIGSSSNAPETISRAISLAHDACLKICDDWISASTCKPHCNTKTSSTKVVSVRLKLEDPAPNKVKVTVTMTMSATVRCSAVIDHAKKSTGKKK